MSDAFIKSYFKREIGLNPLRFSLHALSITDADVNYDDLISLQSATHLTNLTLKSKYLLLKCDQSTNISGAFSLNTAIVNTLCTLTALVFIDIERTTFLWPIHILTVLDLCKNVTYVAFSPKWLHAS